MIAYFHDIMRRYYNMYDRMYCTVATSTTDAHYQRMCSYVRMK